MVSTRETVDGECEVFFVETTRLASDDTDQDVGDKD